jgi:hypothetical protein
VSIAPVLEQARPARPRLRAIVLSGPRRAVRRAGFIAIAVAAVVTAVGYLLPAHRLVYVPRGLFAQTGEATFHSNAADGGPMPLVALATVCVLALVLRGRRWLGAGMLAGALGAGGAVLSVLPVLLVHLLSSHELAIGEQVFVFGVFGLFIASSAHFLVEPVLFVLEGRRLEQAARPAPLPVAVVLVLAARGHSR